MHRCRTCDRSLASMRSARAANSGRTVFGPPAEFQIRAQPTPLKMRWTSTGGTSKLKRLWRVLIFDESKKSRVKNILFWPNFAPPRNLKTTYKNCVLKLRF